MRAKVIKKPEGKERFYGRVGTTTFYNPQERLVYVRFDDGEVSAFRKDELRMGVKASG